MKKTLVIAGFPGVGKSYATEYLKEKGVKVSDSDSSKFSWIEVVSKKPAYTEKVRNPNFVNDYVNHIESLIKEGYDYIFTSTHEEVIKEMLKRKIEFIIVFPTLRSYGDYREIYEKRGDSFKDFILNNWFDFITALEGYGEEDSGTKVIELERGNTMMDLFKEDIIEDVRKSPNEYNKF